MIRRVDGRLLTMPAGYIGWSGVIKLLILMGDFTKRLRSQHRRLLKISLVSCFSVMSMFFFCVMTG